MTQHSQVITRKSASNLALAFILLPKEKRDAMAALYAFCRETDDVADDEAVPVEKRRRELAAWREDVRKACEGGAPSQPVNRELQPIIAQYRLPFAYFDELLRGVEMDLDTNRYETYADLDEYCYRVASVVGLLSIEIFGYTQPATRDYAIALGKALQLTNILRDVGNDATRGRIYLPLAELRRFDVSEEEILKHQYSERFERLARSVAGQAKSLYQKARQSLPNDDRRSMVAAELMGSVYWQLLVKLERRRFNVVGPRPMRLSKGHKIFLILRSWARLAAGAENSCYGIDSKNEEIPASASSPPTGNTNGHFRKTGQTVGAKRDS
jgi:phytoene synthase